jgi:dihydrofolate reductase
MGVSATNDMPWPKHAEDLEHFRAATDGRILIMGRKTFESLPDSKKTPPALHRRPMLVLTTQAETLRDQHGVSRRLWFLNTHDWQQATAHTVFATLANLGWQGVKAAVIGGREVIELFTPFYDRLLVTTIPGPHEGDVPGPSPRIFEAGYTTTTRQLGEDDGTFVTTYTRSA